VSPQEKLEKELLALRDQDASQDDLDREEMCARDAVLTCCIHPSPFSLFLYR
jgi:hypothetical protein